VDAPAVHELAGRAHLKRFAWLSIVVAIVTIALKGAAYQMTGSVGLLSDALESFVNLAGAIMALAMLTVAARPEDDEHQYGHDKAEFFSSGVEGALILIAAGSIAYAAFDRFLHPRPLAAVPLGLAISAVASVANLVVAIVLRRAGRREQSITLEANASHLMADVWTSLGVIVGVGLVALTHWQVLDPVVALLVAVNIVATGLGIMRRSVEGLMDRAVPIEEQQAVQNVLDRYRAEGAEFHALRTRLAGARRFVTVHVLVPGAWTVHDGHLLLERIEADIRAAIPNVAVLTHLESLEDPASWEDITLDRKGAGRS
jgi:cation diffusion facilitator family transporter